MADQFGTGITGCKQCSDDMGFFHDGIAARNSKDECHDYDNNIKKDNNHSTVTAHIVTGEIDRLVQIAGNVVLQRNFLINSLHQVIGNLLFFLIIGRFFCIFPGVDIFNGRTFKFGKSLRCHDSHSEFYRVEHRIIIILEKATVIRKSNQSGDRPFMGIAL